MKRQVKIDLSDAQEECLKDIYSRFLYMSGGYGSGKTYCAVLKLLQLMEYNPGVPGGLLGPNNKMLKRDVIPTIKQICGENGIDFKYRRADGELYFPDTDSTIYIYHAQDDGESIAGANLGFGVVNEASLCSWPAVRSFFGRMRLKRAKHSQIFMCGTPEEFNWVYTFFIEDNLVYKQTRAGRRIIYSSSRANKHTASWYVDMLESSYDDIAKQQYVDGLYVPRTGNRFLHRFNRHQHVTDYAERVPHAQNYVMIDFNVNPMVATIASYVPDSAVKLRMYDEICIDSADTYLLGQTIKDKIGTEWRNSVLFPDPAGNQRKTSARNLITDIKILKEMGFQDVRYKSKISLKNTFYAANNIIDKNMVAIHPRCREFILDAEQVQVKAGAFEMDKKNPRRTHALDGFKNMADYEFPVLESYSEVVNKVIR